MPACAKQQPARLASSSRSSSNRRVVSCRASRVESSRVGLGWVRASSRVGRGWTIACCSSAPVVGVGIANLSSAGARRSFSSSPSTLVQIERGRRVQFPSLRITLAESMCSRWSGFSASWIRNEAGWMRRPCTPLVRSVATRRRRTGVTFAFDTFYTRCLFRATFSNVRRVVISGITHAISQIRSKISRILAFSSVLQRFYVILCLVRGKNLSSPKGGKKKGGGGNKRSRCTRKKKKKGKADRNMGYFSPMRIARPRIGR